MTFQARIDNQMKRFAHLTLPEGAYTIGALIGAVMEIDNETDAREFYDGYLAALDADPKRTHPAEHVAKANIGWCYGEGMSDDHRDMWVRVCGAAHPVFGTEMPSVVHAFNAGKEMGRALR